MTTLADVCSFLSDDAYLTALIGDRLYPVILPQGTARPAMTYQMVAATRVMTWGGPVPLVQHRIQFDAWGDYADVQAVATRLRKRLNGYVGPMGSGETQGAQFLNERDGYEPATKLYRRSCDFSIWLTEDLE